MKNSQNSKVTRALNVIENIAQGAPLNEEAMMQFTDYPVQFIMLLMILKRECSSKSPDDVHSQNERGQFDFGPFPFSGLPLADLGRSFSLAGRQFDVAPAYKC